MVSPDSDIPVEKRADKTKELIEQHPLKPDVIRDIALRIWSLLWQTKIGEEDTSLSPAEINPPATIIGYFFEKLFAKELQKRHPEKWRGTLAKDEKDIVYLEDSKYSIEIKTSGQLDTKIFGNRSYGQEADDSNNEELPKKEKSGYYITANFYQQSLTLLRFGWIDHEDWKPQKSSKGQAATLDEKAYQHKLFTISGEYILNSPVNLLKGVGKTTAEILEKEGIKTLSNLIHYQGNDAKIKSFCEKCQKIPDFTPNQKFYYDDKIINNVFWWLVL
jgi:hypothetical protein